MFSLWLFFALLLLGYVAGRRIEAQHLQSIEQRERAFAYLDTTTSRRPCPSLGAAGRVELVDGACVISVDYFKTIVGSLRQLFGGNVLSYESLVERARREAILRLKASCGDADQIINLRIETSSISKGQRNQIGAIEVHAYATAVYADLLGHVSQHADGLVFRDLPVAECLSNAQHRPW